MPENNIESIISGAMAEATDGGDGGDTLDIDTPDSGGDGGDGTEIADGAGDADAGTEAGETPGDPDAGADGGAEGEEEGQEGGDGAAKLSPEDQRLADLGLTPKIAGKDNRIPYSRAKKIILNGIAKETKVLKDQLAKVETDHAPIRTRAAQMDAVDRTIMEHPDVFMDRLALVNPAFKEYVKGGAKGTAATVEALGGAVAALGPKPTPDVKYPDGTVGYSPEQFDKLGEWNSAVAVAKAEAKWQADLDKRVKPFENQRETAEKIARDNQQRQADIKEQIEEAQEAWGDALPAQGSAEHKEILALIKAKPTMRLTAAVAKVLLPKLRADRKTVHAEVVASMKKAPAGVSKGGGQQGKTAADAGAPKGTEDVIRAAMRTLEGR